MIVSSKEMIVSRKKGPGRGSEGGEEAAKRSKAAHDDSLSVPAQAALLVCYVLLWVGYTLLIAASRSADGDYAYNPLSVILLSETAKLAVSGAAMLLFSGSADDEQEEDVEGAPTAAGNRLQRAVRGVAGSWAEGRYFAVPAMIYAVYNSLSYVNLQLFTPVEFKVLINIRILLTGVTLHWLFGRRLSGSRWLALLFLTVGCSLTQLTADFRIKAEPLHLAVMVLQAFLSSLGGVYSEVLLRQNVGLSLHAKNMYLYAFSIAFNLAWIALADPHAVGSWAQLTRGFDHRTLLLVAVSTLCGLFTAVFLRYLGVIAKEYAHSLEIFSTALFSWLVLGVPLSIAMFASMLLVSISVFIYQRKS